ncbi:hypothetical protein [Qipengyuania atrilutea]|uniref:Uncharacterized protein n=1 Tax=Qipengyuania atrilutea TaxID=2744473 RepID=A0A850HF35_9SPHN|nr:hypothetical protein [Actirhodobacter atriluteus]NVD45919.1 hypothetical protein [Actirhodobacter atriluteus]
MRKTITTISATACAAAIAVAAAAQTPSLPVGTWSQASSGLELVLVSRIKLSPNVGVSMGTSLGGSVGYGSMTRTEIVTEPTLLDVERRMTLTIESDGDFTWLTVREHAEGNDCTRTVRQTKRGRALVAGDNLVLSTSEGRESFSSSCGESGETDLVAGTESYPLHRETGRIELRSETGTWSFVRS